MSSSMEQEKLTPSSLKSYDGSSTSMAEQGGEMEHPEEPKGDEERAEEIHEDSESEEKDKERREAQKAERAESFATLFRNIFAAVHPKEDPKEEKLIADVTRAFIKAEDNPDKKAAKVAEVLSFFLTPEKQSDEEFALDETDASPAIFETVLETAVDTGINRDKILDNLAEIAEKSGSQLPMQDEDRFNALEEHVKETLKAADEKELEQMSMEWDRLRANTTENYQIDEELEEAVEKGDEILDAIQTETAELEAQDGESDQEIIDEYQDAFDKEFAEMIVRVVEARAEKHLEQQVPEPVQEVSEQEKEEAKLLMNILLTPEDSKESKQKMVGTLLKVHFPGEGTEAQKQLVMREYVLQQAELAGLDRNFIEHEEEFVDTSEKTEIVNEYESVPSLDAFERLVEEQIMKASPEKIGEIQAAWAEILQKTDPQSEVYSKAEEAVKVLGDIAKFKTEVAAAHAEGRAVNWDILEKPKLFPEDNTESKDAKGEQSEEDENDEVASEKDDKTEAEEDPKVIETRAEIKRLEAIINTMKEDEHQNEEITAYLDSLLDRLKKGMTAEQVKEEVRLLKATSDPILMQSMQDGDRDLQLKIMKCVGPFNRILNDARRDDVGIVKTESEASVEDQKTEEQNADDQNTEKVEENELVKLTDAIARNENEHMREHLTKLVGQIKEGMSPDEMQQALAELEAESRKVVDEMKGNIPNLNDTSTKNKALFLMAYETNINIFRKYLTKSIQENQVENEPITLLDSHKKDVDALVTDAIEVNETNDLREFNTARFEQFMEHLNEVLSNTGTLNSSQLASVYLALKTQQRLLMEENLRAGKLIDALTIFEKAEEIAIKLHGPMARVYKDEVGKIEKDVDNVVKEKSYKLAEVKGVKFHGKVTAMDKIEEEGDKYGRTPGAVIGDAPDRIKRVRVADVMPANISPQLEREVEQGIEEMRSPEFFAEQEKLIAMQTKLAQLMEEGLANNRNPDGSPNFAAIAGAQELAKAINEQREALATLAGYKGIRERRAEIDPKLYEGFVHEALGERIHRIRYQFEVNGEDAKEHDRTYSDKEILEYYRELQNWANHILDNDVRRNPKKANDDNVLRLSNARYERYKRIVDNKLKKPEDVALNKQMILNNIEYMLRRDAQGGDFLRYFMQNVPNPKTGSADIPNQPYRYENSYNPDGLMGVPYQRPRESGGDIPETLRETMEKIAKDFSNDKFDFHPGGNRELIDSEGNFKYNNFIYWIRLKINEDVDYNNDAPISPFGKIIIKLPMNQISMFELLLLIPEYTSQRKFEIKMPGGKSEEVFSSWGQKAENPNFGMADLGFIGQEMEFRQMTHEARIQYTNNDISGDKEKFLQMMDKLHGANNWTRSSNVFRLLGYPSSVTNNNSTKEVDEWQKDERQGSIGKSMCDMLVAYNYLSELTDYHQIKYMENGKEKKRDKNFNENMFYKFWEPNGANKFLIKMAEGALNYNLDAKKMYVDFLKKRISAAEQAYLSRDLNDKDRETISQMAEQQLDNLDKFLNDDKDKLDKDMTFINFTESTHLNAFHTLVKRDVLANDPIENKKTDEAIAIEVRNELINHLKEEYFRNLVNIKVGKIDKIEKGGKKQDRDSSHIFLRTDGTIRFGDIDVGGMTMQEMLLGNSKDSFDVEQILKFDYSNNPGDLTFENNPHKELLRKIKENEAKGDRASNDEKKALRRALDAWMDPDLNKRNHELFRNNERMMLAFTKHVTRIKRAELNHFRDQHENVMSRDMIARAFRTCIEKMRGIDSTESEYAWWWTRDYVYLWGIGSSLDVTGIGFRQDGKLFNTGIWRPRRMAKDGGGNPHTYDEFLAMSLPFLHHVRVHNTHATDEERGHRSIFYWLQGGEGGYITPRAVREFEPRSHYSFAQGAEQQYVKNTLTSGSELIDLLSKTEFDFSKILQTSHHGNVIFDYGEARKLFGQWRGAIRYAFGKNMLDYREKIWSGGREKTLYEHFFGPKTRALNEIITRNIDKHTVDRMYKEPFDAFMMSVVAAEVAEHRAMFSSGHHWTIQNILELEQFLLEFMDEKAQEENALGEKHSHSTGKLLTPKLFDAALRAYHTGYFKMYAVEFNATFWGGLFNGLWEGVKASVKGVGPK